MDMDIRFFIVVMGILIGGTLIAGCLSVPGLSTAGSFESGKEDGVSVNLISSEPDFSLTKGCFWDVSVQVYNTGQTEARNVEVYLELVDGVSGAVRDSRTVYVGALGPGAAKIVSTELDGDCINEYTLRAVPILL
jgi:hypothetical protein